MDVNSEKRFSFWSAIRRRMIPRMLRNVSLSGAPFQISGAESDWLTWARVSTRRWPLKNVVRPIVAPLAAMDPSARPMATSTSPPAR